MGGEAAAGGEKEEEDIVYTYKPPESKLWISGGSEPNVECEIVQDNRPKVSGIK